MSQVYVDVEALKTFSQNLRFSTSDLADLASAIDEQLAQLGDRWRDAQYLTFLTSFANTRRSLSQFTSEAEGLSDHVAELATILEAYRSRVLNGVQASHSLSNLTVSSFRKSVDEIIPILAPVLLPLLTRWNEISLDQRQAELQRTETSIAAFQGRRPATVSFSALAKGEAGTYDGQTIHISERDAKAGDALEAVDTLLHEGRHAFQIEVAKGTLSYSDTTATKNWRWELEHYTDPTSDPESYWYQQVEMDAREWASTVLSQLLR
jgi:hypothetical protein